ncbi:uncharacterized protein LOC111692216 [Anoplophora glabripennis]|uniref:uncharacterized protein LOC111692216 n=1 Tax=Anoplophora glabripennis TaxID=217634 RepID=UPI000C75969B|nr:uncharacterized protein LOC111692216 [Anoplophora glabripennis]
MESSNEADLDVDMAEVKRVLDDANMFEPNMSKDNMLSYYKVLINSKSTASEEDHTRRLNESQEELMSLLEEENVENTPAKSKEKPFIPKAWTSEKKPSESALEHNNNENILEDNIDDIINDSPKDATKVTFGFNEMAKDSEYTITLITHELKFVPIQSTAKFLNAGTALKAKMLYAYHTKMNKMKTELARTSFYPAPLPKITSTTETFPSFSDSDVPATYTCRSGRQTKRKVYNYDDDDDSLDGITNKKVKNSDEQEWLNKSTPIKSTVRTHKKQETNKIGAEFKTESEESALEHNNNENILEDNIDDIINDSPKDATKVTFGFNEMAKDSEYTITLITHELKFVPIQSTAKFLNAGTALKAKMLYAYHTKMNKMKTELARTSFYPAPLPKITSTTETFPSFSDSDVPATYTCRSGRQTKRKVYNYDDDDDSLDGITNKKVKNSDEQEWLNKSTPIKSTVRTHKKQETNKIGAEFKTESEDINKEKKNIPKKETRTTLSRKLSNAEIMKRSNIFGDLPKRRCEAMFDKLKEEEEKKEKEEKTMEAFNKTLEKLDEENIEASSNEEIITVEDEEFVKRRVVPPLPRKLINRKRHNPEAIYMVSYEVVHKI